MNKYVIQVSFKNKDGEISLVQKEFEANTPEEALSLAKADFPFQNVIFSDPKPVKRRGINIGSQTAATIINMESASNIRIGN